MKHSHDHSHDLTEMRIHESLWEELTAHFPYAIISVALSIITLSLLTYGAFTVKDARKFFHIFHYLHLLFSGTGVILIFRKYSKNVPLGLALGFLVPAVFCTLSDSILPFAGGIYLGLPMHFHICFWDHLRIVLPFLAFGILNGFVMSSNSEGKALFYSTGSHFLHVFISSLASILYFFSYGFESWYSQIGFVFVFLIGAVLIPCSLADIVVPMIFAYLHSKRSKR